jgi:xylan 1,4-beta-xylosidase
MGIARQLTAIQMGFQIVASFPEWKNTPIILGESDPEGCAACSARENPQNGYRNGPLYASYTAETLYNIYELAKREGITFQAEVNWSFEFEDQPYFAGFREMASNGFDKPVLNAFRMFGMLGPNRVRVESSGALATDKIVSTGVRDKPDVNAIAAKRDREIQILAWNYHNEDLAAPDAPVRLIVEGLPSGPSVSLSEHFRVDGSHSNSFAAWQAMGSPQNPSTLQYKQLESTGHLQFLESPRWIALDGGRLSLQFSLPRQGLSLLRIAW